MSRIIRTTTSGNTLPTAGKIKVGDKAKTAHGKEYPVSLDYFRPTGQFAEMFKKQFGDKPNRLKVVFISDDINEVCNERYEAWSRMVDGKEVDPGKRWGYGDGKNFKVYDPASKDYKDMVAGDPALKGFKWKESLTLRFILPELKGVLGYWEFSTGGAKTIIPSLVKSFDFVKERVGTVVGVPWELHVEKAKSYTPGEARSYSKVKIIPVITPENIEILHQFLQAGNSISSIAPMMLDEAKLDRLKLDSAAAEITVDADHEVVTEPAKYAEPAKIGEQTTLLPDSVKK